MWLKKLLRRIPTNHQLLNNIPSGRQQTFQAEAQMIRTSEYYKWFMEDMELSAQRIMFRGNKDNLLIGKGMLIALDLMAKNIETMSNANNKLTDKKEKQSMTRFHI